MTWASRKTAPPPAVRGGTRDPSGSGNLPTVNARRVAPDPLPDAASGKLQRISMFTDGDVHQICPDGRYVWINTGGTLYRLTAAEIYREKPAAKP